MNARCQLIIVGLTGVLALALVLPVIIVCRDWAFIDRNTGSRKGYREWFLLWRTGSWHHVSALETFMRSKHPGQFQQKWISYAGTGRDIFGQARLFGHGRPGPIVMLPPEILDSYCRLASETEQRRLYDLFSGGEREKIQSEVDRIYQAVLSDRGRKAEPSGSVIGSQPIRSATNGASSAAGSRH